MGNNYLYASLLCYPHHTTFPPTPLGIEAMLVAAMKGWALLATTALRSVCLDMLPTLCGLLDSPCPDVRNTAGESLAMLYELHFVPSMECDDDEEEGEGGGAHKVTRLPRINQVVIHVGMRYATRPRIFSVHSGQHLFLAALSHLANAVLYDDPFFYISGI